MEAACFLLHLRPASFPAIGILLKADSENRPSLRFLRIEHLQSHRRSTMPAPRRRNLLRRRRRVDDEGEDEESVATEPLEDSQSEGSLRSDLDDDGDADDSDLSDVDGTRVNGSADKSAPKTEIPSQDNATTQPDRANFTTIPDTEAMMNGLKISDTEKAGESIDFEGPSGGAKGAEPDALLIKPAGRPLSIAERRRKEDEDYRRRREEDPAFIPNRGAFFMHDQRSSNMGQPGLRQFGRGRGRGRPIVGGPHSPAK